MKIGCIGLGKMGSRIAGKLSFEHEVIVWNRTSDVTASLLNTHKDRAEKGFLAAADSVESLISCLPAPRIVWLMLPAGLPTDEVLTKIKPFLNRGDIVIDGGNSRYTDTENRFADFSQRGIRFLGIGVSGGILAEKNGYPLMAGGDRTAYEYIIPLLETLSKPGGGYDYFGPGGAGHFAKMVHNGIEYGIMQSLAEGFEVLYKSPYRYDLTRVAKLYQKGTLVSGFMCDRVVDALEEDPELANTVGVIEHLGEGQWTVETAKKENVAVEIIERSLAFRNRTKSDPQLAATFTARMVAALRHAFGGHTVKRVER